LTVVLLVFPETALAQDTNATSASPILSQSIETQAGGFSDATPWYATTQSQPSLADRDRQKGALYGLGIGVAIGGVGFAALNYALTTNSPRNEYTLLSFLLGAAGGGAAGAVLGAIIGVPEREAPEQKQAELHIFPHVGQNQGLGIAVSLRIR
jgi:hypothetical protein